MRPSRAWQPPVDPRMGRGGARASRRNWRREAGNYAGSGTWAQCRAFFTGRGPAPGSGRGGGEALAAAALGLGVGIAEHEALAQALAGEIDLGAVHQRQAGGVDVDARPVLLEHRVALALLARQVGDVAPSGTPGADRKSTRLNSSHVKIS